MSTDLAAAVGFMAASYLHYLKQARLHAIVLLQLTLSAKRAGNKRAKGCR